MLYGLNYGYSFGNRLLEGIYIDRAFRILINK